MLKWKYKKKIKNNISGEKVEMRKNLIWEIYFPMHDWLYLYSQIGNQCELAVQVFYKMRICLLTYYYNWWTIKVWAKLIVNGNLIEFHPVPSSQFENDGFVGIYRFTITFIHSMATGHTHSFKVPSIKVNSIHNCTMLHNVLWIQFKRK